MEGYGFTMPVRMTLAQAREEAANLNHEYVGPEHILLGLLRHLDGVAAGVLTKFQVEPAAVEGEIVQLVKRGRGPKGGPNLPYTSRAKKVLELAMVEARNLRHSYVGTEHLLIALIVEETSVAAQVLDELGVTLKGARLETLRLLGQSEVVTGDTEWPAWLTGVGPLTRQLTDLMADVKGARTPEDLLQAIIADVGGARHVLEFSGVDIVALSDEIDSRHPGASGAPTSIRELLSAALTEQRFLGDCALASHHILLAYLALRPAHGYRTLTDRGVTHASVRTLAENIFG